MINTCSYIDKNFPGPKSSDSRRQEKKRKSGNDDSSLSKKISGEPTVS